MPLLRQRAGDQLDQMNGNHRNVTAAEDGNPSGSLVLKQGQFLGKGVHPVQCRKIKGSAQ